MERFCVNAFSITAQEHELFAEIGKHLIYLDIELTLT